jgi:predicted transcriptional regulator of viral defense system
MPGKIFLDILDIAQEQHGFVRSADLRDRGISPKRLADYAARGQAEHLGYGLYRLLLVPPSQWDEFMKATIWPDGRGVLSHETALDLHGLCDVNPNHIDITVPETYRTHRAVPKAYRLHARTLPNDGLTYLEGVPIVRPARAIADGIEAGLRPSLLDQAIETAQSQALITTAAADELRASRDQRAHIA